jgi:hypothetical protein
MSMSAGNERPRENMQAGMSKSSVAMSARRDKNWAHGSRHIKSAYTDRDKSLTYTADIDWLEKAEIKSDSPHKKKYICRLKWKIYVGQDRNIYVGQDKNIYVGYISGPGCESPFNMNPSSLAYSSTSQCIDSSSPVIYTSTSTTNAYGWHKICRFSPRPSRASVISRKYYYLYLCTAQMDSYEWYLGASAY